MDSSAIRLANFKSLFHKFRNDHPDLPERGMIKEFSGRITVSDRYVSHILCNRKNIGHSIARRVEAQLKLPSGYMDTVHDDTHVSNDSEEMFIDMAMALYRANAAFARKLVLDGMTQIMRGPGAQPG